MKAYSLIALTTAAAVLSGCAYSPLPIATSYPITAQRKMQAAHHWNVLADHVAERLKASLDANGLTTSPLYIKFPADYEKVEFGKSFPNLLRTRLVQLGTVVVNNPDNYAGALLLEYDMNVIHHKDRAPRRPWPGTFTTITGLAWLIAYGADNWDPAGLAVLPVSVALDAKSAYDYVLPGETNTEVIVNVAVATSSSSLGQGLQSQQYIFGYSDIYYINDGDYDHYERDAKTYRMVNQ